MVFYRKYRPQTLNEVIGQEHVKDALLKAHKADKLSHAYLFCGPKGTGKTSTARILAKIVNCGQAKGDDIPCNECDSCKSITDGSNLDLMEIDAASNRGIDDIRSIRENIKLAPTYSKKKVYIIDEVHMLSTEAFNALLKTLEEPPEHVLFILATTDAHKIPATILSRVQRQEFKEATEADLVTAIKNVATKEEIKIDDEALITLARKSGGSFRDCLKMLDQLASMGEKITTQSIEGSFRSGSVQEVVDLIHSLSKNNTQKALEIINIQISSGNNIKEFLLETLNILRATLLIKNQASGLIRDDFGETNYQLICALEAQLKQEQVLKYLEFFQRALEQQKFSSIPSLPLEIAVVEASRGEKTESPNEVSVVVVETVTVLKQSEEPISQKDDVVTSDDLIIIRDKWNYILETVKPDNFSLEALLKQVKVLSCDNGVIVLEVPYAFHQRILESPKSRNLLESVLTDVLNKPMKVSCVLGERPVRADDIANVELAADDEIIQIAADIFNS